MEILKIIAMLIALPFGFFIGSKKSVDVFIRIGDKLNGRK